MNVTRLSRSLQARRARLAHWLRLRRDRIAVRRASLLARGVKLADTAPEPLHVGDTEVAHALLDGSALIAGGRLDPGQPSPWRVPLRDPAMLAALHGFGWLDDALVARRGDFRQLRFWVFDWLARHGSGAGPGWTPRLAGQRLARLAPAAKRLLQDATPREARALRRALSVHLAFLRARHASEPTLVGKAEAASGLVIGALAVRGRRRSLAAGCRALATLARAVAADGGLPDRRPDHVAALFVHLAWTAHALHAAGQPLDAAHRDALGRLGPAIRALRLGDGGLPRFHGSGATPLGLAPETLDMAFALAGKLARGERITACMGYERLQAGRLGVVIDAAPPPATNPEAAASTLALEIGMGRQRLAGGVGPGAMVGGEWPVAARATAAHSTLEVAGVSSARLAPETAATATLGRLIASGPSTVDHERSSDLDGLWFRADHDGYLARFGLMVGRRLQLVHAGIDLRGEETLTAPSLRSRQLFDRVARRGSLDFCVRFHLAPSVEAETYLQGRAIRMKLPDGSFWIFRGAGGTLQLVESVWIDTASRRARPTRQIVLAGEARAYFGRVTWSLSRADENAQALRSAQRHEPA